MKVYTKVEFSATELLDVRRTLLLLENIDHYGLKKDAEIHAFDITKSDLENLAQFIVENMEGGNVE